MKKSSKAGKLKPKKKKPRKKIGRPSKYSPDVVEALCEQICTTNMGLKSICNSNQTFPDYATVFRWLNSYAEFRDRYARAREAQAELLADEIIDISDDTSGDIKFDEKGNMQVDYEHINRSRLRVDARKWKASKLAPKKFGDKMEIDHTTAGHAFDLKALSTDDLKLLSSLQSKARKNDTGE